MKTKDYVVLILLTIVLSFVGTIIGISISLNISRAIYSDINFWLLVHITALLIIHELTHFYYLYTIGRASNSKIQYKFNLRTLSYWIYTDQQLSKRNAMVYLTLPFIIMSILSIVVIINSLNVSYSVLLGYSFGLSSLDLFLVHKLSRISHTKVSLSKNSPLFE